jgi:hypothetical protein
MELFSFKLVYRANPIFFKYLLHVCSGAARPGLNARPGGHCCECRNVLHMTAECGVTAWRTTQLSYHCRRVLFSLCGKRGRWPPELPNRYVSGDPYWITTVQNVRALISSDLTTLNRLNPFIYDETRAQVVWSAYGPHPSTKWQYYSRQGP